LAHSGEKGAAQTNPSGAAFLAARIRFISEWILNGTLVEEAKGLRHLVLEFASFSFSFLEGP